MKIFNFFPEEIRREIYLFDATRKDIFSKTLHQLKFIPVLMQLEVRSNLFRNMLGDYWYKYYFYQYEMAVMENVNEDADEVLNQVWKRFCRKRLRSV